MIHRRDEFRGAQATIDKVHQLAKDGKINLFTQYQMASVKGDKNLESIDIKHDNNEIKNLKTDYVLGFFGLIMQLGPIANWGLNIDKKTIEVDTEKFETNQKGIYAVGDICNYPGKLKLILSGFHEGALAARACFKLARPNEKYRFEFTTSSKTIKERLGVKKVIELYSANTPNGKKISIMLEEIGYEYKVINIDLNKGDQFKPEFKKISPFSKIPVIIDQDNNKNIFESGAILMYLAEQSGKFYDTKDRLEINQWLMAQMGYVGPMLGQHHQFHHYNPGKSQFGEERYFKISKRIYEELDERLSKSRFLAGENYTIADIGTFPWIARHEWHDIGLKNYKNLTRWYVEISEREAVKKGFKFMNKDEVPPKP